MNKIKCRALLGFYENELTNNLLYFWKDACLDKEYGGYLNCYDNMGKQLVSYDKYTWSMGRFVWMWSKLAMMKGKTFNQSQKNEFLALAKNGRDFLMQHCLMGKNDWRCVFLMERDGTPKKVEGWDVLDMSVYADCFVVAGIGKYAEAANDRKAYAFAKQLFLSLINRIESGSFHTLPYPLSPRFRAHGIPMILTNVIKELHGASEKMDLGFIPTLLTHLKQYSDDILDHFADENNVIHEVISVDNTFIPQILGQHANPGHTIEDMWFQIDAADLLGDPTRLKQIFGIVKKALEIGWDEENGGILHFVGVDGGEPTGEHTGMESEPMVKQLSDWNSKLWWVHSEALYITLLCFVRSGDDSFLTWHDQVFEYTFSIFPNPDREVREWIQIRDRKGKPQNKVVALPVKDPYHIVRNIIFIIELLYQFLNE
jgi:N-acylglucosamine 2-epimerase